MNSIVSLYQENYLKLFLRLCLYKKQEHQIHLLQYMSYLHLLKLELLILYNDLVLGCECGCMCMRMRIRLVSASACVVVGVWL